MSYELTEDNNEENIPADTTTLIVKVHIVPTLTFMTPDALTTVKFEPFLFVRKEIIYSLLQIASMRNLPSDVLRDFLQYPQKRLGTGPFSAAPRSRPSRCPTR